MSAVDPNGSPVLVVGGGGGGASLPTDDAGAILVGVTVPLSDAPNAAAGLLGPDVNGDGALFTGSQVRALGRTIDPMTGTGWTSLTPASGATTTWASGKLTLAVPTGTSVFDASGIERSGFLPDGNAYDLCVRYDVVAGDTNAAGKIVIAVGESAADSAYFVHNNASAWVIGRKVGGAWTQTSTGSSGASAGDRTGGQFWWRITRSPFGYAISRGVGSGGALPTRWTLVHSGTDVTTLSMSCGQYVRIGLDVEAPGVSGGVTLDVLAIRTSAAGAPL